MPCSAKIRLIAAPVPAGTVDFITSACWSEAGIALTTAWTAERSASPEYVGGVPTATNSSRQRSSAGARSVSEMQPFPIAGDRLLEPRFVDRDLAAIEARDLVRVDVDAVHLAAEFGKPGGGHKSDISGADHGYRFTLGGHANGRG